MGIIIARFSVSSIFPAYYLMALVLILALWASQAPNPSPTAAIAQEKLPEGGLSATKKRDLLLLCISILLIYLSYTSINTFHINIITAAGGNEKTLGLSIFIAAMVELPAMAIFPIFCKRFSYRGLLCFSCAFFCLKVLLLLLSNNLIVVLISQFLQFFSYGLFTPASAYFINSILPAGSHAKGQTLLGIFTFGLSGLFSGLISGRIIDLFSLPTLLGLETILSLIGLVGVFYFSKKLLP